MLAVPQGNSSEAKARPCTSKKSTSCFLAVVWNQTHNMSEAAPGASMFKLVKPCQAVAKAAAPVYIAPSRHEGSKFSTSSPTLVTICLLDDSPEQLLLPIPGGHFFHDPSLLPGFSPRNSPTSP